MPANQAGAVESAARIPPIVIELTVRCPPPRAFDYFTRDLARWWPLDTYSVGQTNVVDARIEPREGGRVFETQRDGSEALWGTVLAWQPGARFAMTWHPGRDPSTAQRVEVTFAPRAGGTLVRLVHDGWDAMGERGASVRGAYASGWKLVFEQRYGAYCNTK